MLETWSASMSWDASCCGFGHDCIASQAPKDSAGCWIHQYSLTGSATTSAACTGGRELGAKACFRYCKQPLDSAKSGEHDFSLHGDMHTHRHASASPALSAILNSSSSCRDEILYTSIKVQGQNCCLGTDPGELTPQEASCQTLTTRRPLPSRLDVERLQKL